MPSQHRSRPANSRYVDNILTQARLTIEVSRAELDEARTRRSAIGSALQREFPGSRVYVNGSLAHGDANCPLTDFDLGVVIANPDGEFGPGATGPTALQERAADAIRRELKATYGDLRVEVTGRKRSILVRFRDPIVPGQPDFTGDVIIALDNPGAEGLFIPRFHMWDRSHPEKHTELVLLANAVSASTFARTVRLVKHWNCQHGKPLCSWHIKALALDVITAPMSPSEALLAWFEHAAKELANGDTPDPAGVAAKPIITRVDRQVASQACATAADQLRDAAAYASEGYEALAQDKLAKWMNDPDVIAPPAKSDVISEGADRLRPASGPSAATLITGVGVGVGAAAARPNVRSWRP